MTYEAPDLLGHGSDEPPGYVRLPTPPPWLRILAAALVVVLAGAVLLHQQRKHAVRPSPQPTTTTSPGDFPPGFFNVGTICTPLTDGINTLVLSFTLTNISPSTATVVRVEPVLPLQGLTTASIDIAGGTCTERAGAPTLLEVDPGASLLVSFRFLLPQGQCPKPLPVQARVDVRTVAAVITDVVPVYPDLGSIDFASCHASG